MKETLKERDLPNTAKIRESLGVKEWTSLEDAILKTAKFTF